MALVWLYQGKRMRKAADITEKTGNKRCAGRRGARRWPAASVNEETLAVGQEDERMHFAPVPDEAPDKFAGLHIS
jgi:hypothetical protein